MTVSTIAWREFIEYVRDRRLIWMGGLVLVLLLTALAVGWQQQATLQAERTAAQASDYDDWLSQGARHPHDAAHQGLHVFKPEPPLSVIDPGIAPYVGSTLWLQAHRQSETKFRPAQDATGLQRFGTLSAAWVVQVLGPLLVIVLGFNAFAGERENGTLRQLMSLGISSRQLLMGKALALGAALAILLAPAALVATVAVVVQSATHTADTLLRLAAMALGYVLYLVIAVFVVLAISARQRSTRGAMTVLLATWIVCVLLLPRAISDFTDFAFPAPSRNEFNSELDSDMATAQAQVWQSRFGVETSWSPDLPLNQWGSALAANDKAGYGVLDRHFNALWDTFEAQQTAQEAAGLIAPVLALRSWSMTLAGTDFAQHRDFSVAAERHRRLMQDVISEHLIEHVDPLGGQHFSYDAAPDLWAEVPRFDYSNPPVSFALHHGWLALFVLLLGAVLSVVAAIVALPRRPI